MEFRNLKDVKKVWNLIRWDLTPMEVTVRTRKAFGDLERYRKMFEDMRGYYFCINVWGCRADLALVDHVERVGEIHILDTDIPNDLLEKAVFEQGGSMLIGGLYAINEKIKSLILEEMGMGKGGVH